MPRSRSRSQSPKRSHHDTYRSRTRSRSPRRSVSPDERHRHRHRHHRHRHRGDRHKEKQKDVPTEQPVLPFNARPLVKHDLGTYRPLFASYLDLQKQIFIDDLSEHEVKGRWKSFVNRWNRRELAEGWYEPAMLVRCQEAAAAADAEAEAETESESSPGSTYRNQQKHEYKTQSDRRGTQDDRNSGSDSDDYGPAPPPASGSRNAGRLGAAPAKFSDLAERDALNAADAQSAHSTLRHERRAERKQQRERLDELAPRAEPGTRERQLEKKREVAAGNRAFRDAREADVEEVGEGTLLGAGGVEEARRMRKEEERKKNEREIRREEVLRARREEREERLRETREKEAKTLEMLKALAKERFG